MRSDVWLDKQMKAVRAIITIFPILARHSVCVCVYMLMVLELISFFFSVKSKEEIAY